MKKFLAIGALLCAATAAQAAISVNYVDATFAGGIYSYEYSISQAEDDTIESGDFFTMYDFTGLIVTAPNAPAGPNSDWTPTWALVGPNTPWIKFTYGGTTLTGLANPLIDGFIVKSTVGPNQSQILDWTASNHASSGFPAGSFGTTTGPNPSPVPEPATMSLMGGALLGLGLLARRRK